MTDQLPSKERVDRAIYWSTRAPSVSDAQVLAEEVKRLRTALTGISTCSTCEACRGAADRALGGVQVVSNAPVYPYQQNPIGSASISTAQPPGDGQ